MSNDFQDICIIGLNTEATRQSPTAPGLRLVHLQLSASPPIAWEQLFDAERQFPRHTRWRDAKIQDDNVVVDCVPEEIEEFHLKDLKEDVKNANFKYRQYLEDVARRTAQDEEEAEREHIRLKELGDRLDFD